MKTSLGIAQLVARVAICLWCPLAILSAQPVRTSTASITDQTPCSSCALKIERIATLRALTIDDSPDDLSRVAEDSRGRFFVTTGQLFAKDRILVFGSDGKHRRTLGGNEALRGQFRAIIAVSVDNGDSLHVIEADGRHSVLSPSLEFVRVSTPLLVRVRSALPLANGNLLIQADIPTPDLVGIPLHRLTSNGTITQSFGGASRVLPGDYWSRRRILALSETPQEVWVARVNSYELQRWTLDGVLKQTIRRQTDWFDPWTAEQKDAPLSSPSSPKLLGLVSVDSSRLLTRISVADDDWRPATGSDRGRLLVDPEWLTESFDTILELLDARQGTLIARLRTDMALGDFIGPDRAFRLARDSDGVAVIEVWRVRILSATESNK